MLELAKDIEGRVFLRNQKGQLIAEIKKSRAGALDLGLDPGKYNITVESSSGLLRGTVDVTHGQKTIIAQSHLDRDSRELTVTRGNLGTAQATQPKPAAAPPTIVRRPFQLGLSAGGISLLPLHLPPEGVKVNNFVINIVGDGHYLMGAEISALGALRYYDVNGM